MGKPPEDTPAECTIWTSGRVIHGRIPEMERKCSLSHTDANVPASPRQLGAAWSPPEHSSHSGSRVGMGEELMEPRGGCHFQFLGAGKLTVTAQPLPGAQRLACPGCALQLQAGAQVVECLAIRSASSTCSLITSQSRTSLHRSFLVCEVRIIMKPLQDSYKNKKIAFLGGSPPTQRSY